MDMSWRLFAIVSISTFVCISTNHLAAQISDEKRLDAASLFEGAYSNALAIQQGDLLMKVEKRFDSSKMATPTDTFVIEEEKFYRIRFDHTTKRILAVRLSKNSLLWEPLEKSAGDLIFKEGQSSAGLLFTEETMLTRRSPESAVSIQKSAPRSKLLSTIGIPEIRNVGLVTFGGMGQFHQVEIAADQLATGDQIKKVSSLKGSSQTIELEVSRAEMKQTFAMKFVMDVERMLPSQRDISLKTKTGNTIISEEKIRWAEFDGVFVPSVIEKRNNGQRSFKGMTYYSVVDTKAKLHWYSVNKPIPDELFGKELLEDTNEMLKLVDPVASDAETLIDEKREKEPKGEEEKAKKFHN